MLDFKYFLFVIKKNYLFLHPDLVGKMVVVAQLVRALVCGTRGRRFEPDLPPKKPGTFVSGFFNSHSLLI